MTTDNITVIDETRTPHGAEYGDLTYGSCVGKEPFILVRPHSWEAGLTIVQAFRADGEMVYRGKVQMRSLPRISPDMDTAQRTYLNAAWDAEQARVKRAIAQRIVAAKRALKQPTE